MSGSAAELLAERLEMAQRRIAQLESCLHLAVGFIKGQSLQAAEDRKAARQEAFEEAANRLEQRSKVWQSMKDIGFPKYNSARARVLRVEAQALREAASGAAQ